VRTARVDLDANFSPPVPLPAWNLVVVPRLTGLVWLDADTLSDVDGPPGLPDINARLVAFSPDGTLAAVTRQLPASARNETEVYDLGLCGLTALFDRSLARMVPADLATVEAQAARTLAAPVAAAVELLRVGLAYRFGADIALGGGDRVVTGADDIVLGGAG
jgi:hypothetical protein